MVTLDDALARVLANTPLPTSFEKVRVERASGRILAEEVRADTDLPPFDRAAMDGYALRSTDLGASPSPSLRVIGEIAAGSTARLDVQPGTAVGIMTGAPIPDGADAVVPVEETESLGRRGCVRILGTVRPGDHIRRRGEAVRAGETVLQAGLRLRPIDVAVLGTAGLVEVRVSARPRVAILSTGDELAPAERKPGPGQIRNSNGPMLAAAARGAGARVVSIDVAPDRPDVLAAKVRAGLAADFLLLSGGVSRGTKDHVAEVLEGEGVSTVFHRVAIRPGKPIFFGRKERTLAFGFPGNPVSAYLDFELFARPALDVRQGRAVEPRIPRRAARAAAPFPASERVSVFTPCRLGRGGDLPIAHPVRYTGSGDMHGAARGDGYVLIEAGGRAAARGDAVSVFVPGDDT